MVPARNEDCDLERSVRRLRAYLDACFPFHTVVTIADSGSTDGTHEIGERLAASMAGVRYMRISGRSRGRALAATWLISRADVVACMDVDPSTDLSVLLPLVAPVISRHSDLAVGFRIRSSSKRALISSCYNALIRIVLGATLTDSQCRFKAIRTEVARRLIPQVQERSWFFDTELLVLAERKGMRIAEVPVRGNDGPNSPIRIEPSALAGLRGVWRLMITRPTRFARFAAVGITSTVAYVLIYLTLRDFLPAWTANAMALIVTGAANTAANRRFTFGVRGREGRAGDYVAGVGAFALALLLTTATSEVMRFFAPHATAAVEIMVLTPANLVATLGRYRLFRGSMGSRLQVVAADGA